MIFMFVLERQTENPCEAWQECVPGDSCEKFTAEKRKLAGLSRGSDERKMLLERLQSLVCNKEEKKVCCDLPSLCGISSFVMNTSGVRKAEKDNLPWMVSLFNQRGRLDVDVICVGVLISRKHVLTVASCVATRDWRRGEIDVRLAQIDITEREEAGTEASISHVKIHEM